MSSSPHSRRLAAAVVIGVGATAFALASGALSSKREKQPQSVYAEPEFANDPNSKGQKGMNSADVRRAIHGKVT